MTTHPNLNELDLRSMSTDELERMPPSPRYPDARILAELRRRDAEAEGRIAPQSVRSHTPDLRIEDLIAGDTYPGPEPKPYLDRTWSEREARTPLGHPWT